MIKNIIKHSQTDPNAPKHMKLGMLASVVFSTSVFVLTSVPLFSILAFLLGGMIMGITIEAVQRVQRYGKTQNTWLESYRDAMVTFLWYALIWR